MLAAEHRRRNEKAHRAPGKIRPAAFAFSKPKASARKLHHPDMAPSKSKTPEQRCSRVLEVPISNGASPVASALGIRSGATLCGRHQSNRASPGRPSKQDISTLLGIGHFYFALTASDTQSGWGRFGVHTVQARRRDNVIGHAHYLRAFMPTFQDSRLITSEKLTTSGC